MLCPHSLYAGYEVETDYIRIEVTDCHYYLSTMCRNLVVLLSVLSKNGSQIVCECVAVALFEDVKCSL